MAIISERLSYSIRPERLLTGRSDNASYSVILHDTKKRTISVFVFFQHGEGYVKKYRNIKNFGRDPIFGEIECRKS